MIQDQLTKYERLRLEAFSQAVNSVFAIEHHGLGVNIDNLFEHAKKIEDFLKAANPN